MNGEIDDSTWGMKVIFKGGKDGADLASISQFERDRLVQNYDDQDIDPSEDSF